jgi:ABC-2 type transport system ATP-binding protein
MIRPTAGSVRVFGLDARGGRARIHARVGYLPGESGLYDRLTAAEYLRFFASLRGGVPERAARDLAERLGLDLRERIRAMSHGTRQKVAVVQAFMHRPDLLVLDEPTQGLDPLVQREFAALVDEARREGRTVFLSSHVMPEVERLCDRVAVIREGRLITVEDIGTLKARAIRTVWIHFDAPVPAEVFAGLPGVREAVASGDEVRCTVEGPLDPLVKTAARYPVVDLSSHEPSLEEIFLAFYGPHEPHEPEESRDAA